MFPIDPPVPPEPKYQNHPCHWCDGTGREPRKPDWVSDLEGFLLFCIGTVAIGTFMILSLQLHLF